MFMCACACKCVCVHVGVNMCANVCACVCGFCRFNDTIRTFICPCTQKRWEGKEGRGNWCGARWSDGHFPYVFIASYYNTLLIHADHCQIKKSNSKLHLWNHIDNTIRVFYCLLVSLLSVKY